MAYIIPDKRNTTSIEINVPTELLDQAKLTAEEKGYSFSELITTLLLQALGEEPRQISAENDYYTAQETAEILNITIVTLYNWIKSGKIEAHKIGGKWVVNRDVVTKLALGVK